MGKKYISEEQVKKALGIQSFRNLSKDKVMKFVSLIPQMEKEVAIAIINQFPVYAEQAGNMITCLRDICDRVLESNDKSQSDAVHAYQTVLNSLAKRLDSGELSVEDQKYFTEKMVEVADKVADLDKENKSFLLKVLTTGAWVIGGALLLGAALLGVNAEVSGPVIKEDALGKNDDWHPDGDDYWDL